jgi:hypothetical protein
MAKTKLGDSLSCSVCGLVVTVDEVCGCDETVVVCCDQPMVKGKPTASKARKMKAKIAPPKAAAKASAKPARTGALKKSKKTAKK